MAVDQKSEKSSVFSIKKKAQNQQASPRNFKMMYLKRICGLFNKATMSYGVLLILFQVVN